MEEYELSLKTSEPSPKHCSRYFEEIIKSCDVCPAERHKKCLMDGHEITIYSTMCGCSTDCPLPEIKDGASVKKIFKVIIPSCIVCPNHYKFQCMPNNRELSPENLDGDKIPEWCKLEKVIVDDTL